MRILLTGTRSFGVAVYRRLEGIGGVDIPVVVAPPGDKLATIAASEPHTESGVLRHEITPDLVADHGIDLIVAAHSHAFIGQRSRKAARLGAIGYHPSLLPRHRGKDAVRWTIHMGDPVAGGSVYWFTNSVDCGPIQIQDFCLVRPGWDHHDLWQEELFPMGVRLLESAVRQILSGYVIQIDQDPKVATWEPSWERPPVHRPELIELGDGSGHAFEIQKGRWPGHPVGMM